MDAQAQVTELLEKHWPDECDAIGPTYMNEIAAGKVDFRSAKGGSYIDFQQVIAVLTVAAAYIKICIDVYKIIKESQGRNPTAAELEAAVAEKKPVTKNIPSSLQTAIIKDIVEAQPSTT